MEDLQLLISNVQSEEIEIEVLKERVQFAINGLETLLLARLCLYLNLPCLKQTTSDTEKEELIYVE